MADLATTLNDARRRVLAGEDLSITEQAELVKLLRQNRNTAAEAGAKSRTKKSTERTTKAGISDEDLDAALGDLGL